MGNRLTQVHLEKWPLKRSVYVCMLILCQNNFAVEAHYRHRPHSTAVPVLQSLCHDVCVYVGVYVCGYFSTVI